MFKRLLFGINLATDEYQKKMMELFGEQDGVEVIVDDILVHGRDQAEHDSRLEVVMSKIKEIGFTFKQRKVQIQKE